MVNELENTYVLILLYFFGQFKIWRGKGYPLKLARGFPCRPLNFSVVPFCVQKNLRVRIYLALKYYTKGGVCLRLMISQEL